MENNWTTNIRRNNPLKAFVSSGKVESKNVLQWFFDKMSFSASPWRTNDRRWDLFLQPEMMSKATTMLDISRTIRLLVRIDKKRLLVLKRQERLEEELKDGEMERNVMSVKTVTRLSQDCHKTVTKPNKDITKCHQNQSMSLKIVSKIILLRIF